MVAVDLVIEAAKRLEGRVFCKPVLYSRPLAAQTAAHVYFKLESEQDTGSFKLRGALNKILATVEECRDSQRPIPDFVTASSGNHGIAVATALESLGLNGTVVIPTNTVEAKVKTLQSFQKLSVVRHGTDCVHAETQARNLSNSQNSCYVSPYNDPYVIAGQGSIAVEISKQMPKIDAVFVTIGGGGLISGVATYLKHVHPNCKIIGCQPKCSPVMALSVQRGRILGDDELEPLGNTLADGSAGGIELDSITFDICQRLVDEYVLVDEHEIGAEMSWMLTQHHKVIEGAAGVALAAFRKIHSRFVGQTVVVLICGSNVSTDILFDVYKQHQK